MRENQLWVCMLWLIYAVSRYTSHVALHWHYACMHAYTLVPPAAILQHAHSVSVPVDTHARAEVFVLLSHEPLCQHISKLLTHQYVLQNQLSTCILLPQKMMLYSDMLGMSMVCQVLCNCDGRLIANEQCHQSLLGFSEL